LSINSAEFAEVAEEVFDEYLPKVKRSTRAEFLEVLIAELRDRGADIDLVDAETEVSGNLFKEDDF
jgi:hypothetical protein